MPVFFISSDQQHNGLIIVTGPLLTHLRGSLRVRVGDTIKVGDEHRTRYLIQVIDISRQQLRGRVLEELEGPPPPDPAVSLGQAILKGDRMDWVIQKASELGVASITPLLSRHVVAKPVASRQEAHRQRWQRIALEAAQQSERWDIPGILSPHRADEYFKKEAMGTLNLLFVERGPGASLSSVLLPSSPDALIRIAIGPEGGWADDEVKQAIECGFKPVSLGSRILRAETAALAALSILQSRLGEL